MQERHHIQQIKLHLADMHATWTADKQSGLGETIAKMLLAAAMLSASDQSPSSAWPLPAGQEHGETLVCLLLACLLHCYHTNNYLARQVMRCIAMAIAAAATGHILMAATAQWQV